MLQMYLIDPKNHILKVLCQYLYYWLRYRLNKENRPIVIMPTTQNLPKYPKSSMTFLMYWIDPKDHFVKVSCQYHYYWLRYNINKENRHIVIMPTQPKLTQVTRVIHDILNVVVRPQESFDESFVSISLLLSEIQVKQRKQTYSDHAHLTKNVPKYPESSMTFLMQWVDLNDHMLKVSF